MVASRKWKLVVLCFGALLLNSAYLLSFSSATVFYVANVLLHLVLGALLLLFGARYLLAGLADPSLRLRTAALFLLLGALLGLFLIISGATRPFRLILWSHILFSAVGTLFLAARVLGRTSRGFKAPLFPLERWMRLGIASVVAVAFLFPMGSFLFRLKNPSPLDRIQNPPLPPTSMEGEGGGPEGPFFPSSALTANGKFIPADFFMSSESCKRCHPDIYEQWNSSAHHFASFNNQWYRKSVEYMQEVVGTRPSKWCGGCHDHAVLFSGQMDTPIKQIVHSPAAQAGLGCVSCHAIVHVNSSMGNGSFVIEYPRLHELATSETRFLRQLHDFVVNLNPKPHRRIFLKPFMRQQTAEFCSACHKVHLDVPVNAYRWIRGFNEYDNWQASGVSGQGARSFYYPPKAMKCADCHMPLVPSKDKGNINGYVHSHRFPGANTALPVANQDDEQLRTIVEFLRNKAVSVDIFAVGRSKLPVPAGGAAGAEMATMFAVGEEAEVNLPAAATEAVAVSAPLDRVQPVVRRGETVRVDVVVRTRNVGHFFPGGTVDAFDVWLELQAVDDRGKVLFWSGIVEDAGKGPVEKGAHFYRSLQVDEHGNPINKRNAWATRAVVYVRLIPPGAADTVHYRLRIPEEAGDRIRLLAKLNYRKFSWWNTHFSFAGVRDPGTPRPAVAPGYDDGRWVFAGDPSATSGKIKRIPNLPLVTMAEAEATLSVGSRSLKDQGSAKAPEQEVLLSPADRDRWNDYGIGLLLQGDLKGAGEAFRRVTQIDPSWPDGWVNISRATLQEGNLAAAREALERALALAPSVARAHFFYAMVLKAEGKFPEALSHLRQAAAQYPRDRVVRNQIGRILFLERRYHEAIVELKKVLEVDPEDLQAHYNLMLCYQGVGDLTMAQKEKQLYLRFKAHEPSEAITGPYRRQHPEDNNERQTIHEHVSVPLAHLNSKRQGTHTGGD